MTSATMHVTYKITFMIYISAHSNHLTLFTVINNFFQIKVDQLSEVRNSVFLNFAIALDGACNGYLGGVLLYMANPGMCRCKECCQSTESRHTRHKRAIIKRHLISTNRNIHPYIIQIRTPGKLSCLDFITGRHNTVLVQRTILKEAIVASIFWPT